MHVRDLLASAASVQRTFSKLAKFDLLGESSLRVRPPCVRDSRRRAMYRTLVYSVGALVVSVMLVSTAVRRYSRNVIDYFNITA